jgi:hypothetical protein
MRNSKESGGVDRSDETRVAPTLRLLSPLVRLMAEDVISESWKAPDSQGCPNSTFISAPLAIIKLDHFDQLAALRH